MSEEVTKWLIVSAVVTLFAVWHLAGRTAEKRRRRHFAQLAEHFGGEMKIAGDGTLSFIAEVAERTFEARDGHRGGGIGSEATATRYLTFSTELRGPSWDLHDVKITPRRGRASEFDERFKVEQFGMRLPDRWLSEDVRAAITSLSPDSNAAILIEGGRLVYRTMASIRELSPEQVEAHLRAQATLAGALERTRRN